MFDRTRSQCTNKCTFDHFIDESRRYFRCDQQPGNLETFKKSQLGKKPKIEDMFTYIPVGNYVRQGCHLRSDC